MRRAIAVAVASLMLAWGLAGPAEAQRRETGRAAAPAEIDPAIARARQAVRVRDFEEAVRLWREAAARGNAQAQYRLGVAYRTARGVEQDYASAARWFARAAENGDLDARFALAKLFESGLGVDQNRERAIEHLSHAARRGHERSAEALRVMQQSQSIAYSTADPRIAAHRRDPREALGQAIRLGDLGAAREALARGAPVDGAPGDERHARPLILAIELQRREIVSLLLEHRANADRRSRLGEPALIVATRHADPKLPRLLLQAGASPQAKSASGSTALMEAARRGKRQMVADLLSAGADPKQTLPDGTSAADLARRFGFANLATRLQRAGASTLGASDDADRLARLASTARENDAQAKGSLPPHLEAARRGDAGLLREMRTRGIDLGGPSPDGDHALHFAADAGHTEATDVLLAAGAAVDARGQHGATPLMRAMASREPGAQAVLERLTKAGADPHLRDERGAPLIEYAAEGATARKLELLRGAGGSWTEREGAEALDRAAASSRPEVVEALLGAVADPQSRMPALCSALGVERDEVLDLLLREPLPLAVACPDGRSPLMVAVSSGRLDHVERLLAAGADPARANASGDTPLIAAASHDQPEIVERLVAAGADVDWRGAHRMTALMGAASNGHADIVRILLAAGADRRMRGETGQTAADLALAASHVTIAELIQTSGGWRSWLGGTEGR